MKIILHFIALVSINLYANENWIKIEPINQPQTINSKTKLDVNLSQIEPVNKMMKRVTVIKQLIDATNKKDQAVKNDKNWFVFNNEGSK